MPCAGRGCKKAAGQGKTLQGLLVSYAPADWSKLSDMDAARRRLAQGASERAIQVVFSPGHAPAEVLVECRGILEHAFHARDGVDRPTTLDDIREAVTRFEDTERIVRRVFGGAHPLALRTEVFLRNAREILAARETPSPGAA